MQYPRNYEAKLERACVILFGDRGKEAYRYSSGDDLDWCGYLDPRSDSDERVSINMVANTLPDYPGGIDDLPF